MTATAEKEVTQEKEATHILIKDDATVRIVREEMGLTGTASLASTARAMIQEAHAIRRQHRVQTAIQQPATA